MILVLAAWFLGERITPTFVALSMVAVVGMIVVLYEPPSIGSSQLIGVALTLAGIACCAAYTVITRRLIPDAKETSQVVLAQQAHALVLALGLVVIAGLAGGAIVPASLTLLGLASAIGSGVLYYAGAYWFYLGALRHVPASLAAVSFYLIPIAGLAASALLLGERLDLRGWGRHDHRPGRGPDHRATVVEPGVGAGARARAVVRGPRSQDCESRPALKVGWVNQPSFEGASQEAWDRPGAWRLTGHPEPAPRTTGSSTSPAGGSTPGSSGRAGAIGEGRGPSATQGRVGTRPRHPPGTPVASRRARGRRARSSRTT